jgi:signal-transduction protein with cAMP-binding, CBS, and nucleotidyltransferase domain
MSNENFNYSLIKVEDIMAKTLISVNPSTTAFQVAKMMEQGRIGAIIVQENKIPIGIVTDRDYATKIAAEKLSFDTTVEKIMSHPLISISHSESILAAAELMSNKKIRKLAVSNNGSIVGIITSTDLVNQLALTSSM